MPAIPALVVAFVGTVAGRVLNIVVAGTRHVAGVKGDAGGQALKPLLHPHLWNDAAANILGRVVYTSIGDVWRRDRRRVGSGPPRPPVHRPRPRPTRCAPSASDFACAGPRADAGRRRRAQCEVLAHGTSTISSTGVTSTGSWRRCSSSARRGCSSRRPRSLGGAEVARSLVVGAVVAVVVLAFALIRPPTIKGARAEHRQRPRAAHLCRASALVAARRAARRGWRCTTVALVRRHGRPPARRRRAC